MLLQVCNVITSERVPWLLFVLLYCYYSSIGIHIFIILATAIHVVCCVLVCVLVIKASHVIGRGRTLHQESGMCDMGASHVKFSGLHKSFKRPSESID